MRFIVHKQQKAETVQLFCSRLQDYQILNQSLKINHLYEIFSSQIWLILKHKKFVLGKSVSQTTLNKSTELDLDVKNQQQIKQNWNNNARSVNPATNSGFRNRNTIGLQNRECSKGNARGFVNK